MQARSAVTFLLLAAACGADEERATVPLATPSCSAPLEPFGGRCVDPRSRYEPDARVDFDNVRAYGDPLSRLALPDPPKSGFRIIAPPRLMQPGEEVDMCLSWAFPSFENRVVYASRVYTTSGLHHSNVVSKPVSTELGPNPYPACHPGAGDPFSAIGDGVPDVLFANSTQIVGEEDLVFPPGMGFRVDPQREITTDIHYLNVESEPRVVEVAYDFFTMSDEELATEVAPFVATINDFLVPAKSKKTIEAVCSVFGGDVVSFMPHTHQYASAFTVDLVSATGALTRVMTHGAYDAASDIEIYDDGIPLAGSTQLHFACDFDNTTDHAIRYGLGGDEMCILFGYVHPVKSQFAAFVATADDPCTSIQIGLFH